MTPLRKRMIEDLQVRKYGKSTQYNYLRCVSNYADFFRRSPKVLGQEDVRTFLVYLATDGKASFGLLRSYVSALRFLYHVTLGQAWAVDGIPFPKREKTLPTIPSREEVLRFLKGVPNIKHRAALMACYAGAAVVSGCAQAVYCAAGWSFTSAAARGRRIASFHSRKPSSRCCASTTRPSVRRCGCSPVATVST